MIDFVMIKEISKTNEGEQKRKSDITGNDFRVLANLKLDDKKPVSEWISDNNEVGQLVGEVSEHFKNKASLPQKLGINAETTLPGAKDVGAMATKKESNSEKQTLNNTELEFAVKEEKIEPAVERKNKLILQKINDLRFDIEELEREGKKGFEVLAKKKEDELRKLESRINNSNNPVESGFGEDENFRKVDSNKIKSEPVLVKETKIIQPVEKGQDLKKEFYKKYPNILKTNRFRQPGEKGEWVYISEYNEKTKEVLCRFGEDGKNRIITERIKLADFDAILKKYAYAKSGSKIESGTQNNKETITEEKMEQIKEETLGLERFCKVHYEIYEKRADWQHFSEKEKDDFLSSVVGSHARKIIETKSEFLKDLREEEKQKIIEKIKQKVTQK